MKIGVLGTGVVGSSIGSKMIELGHNVKMGARDVTNEKAEGWVKANGLKASQGTFRDAAFFGEIIFNCTAGMASLAALAKAGSDNLTGKILIDVANPLDFSKGMPPTLSVCNTDSLGEQIQRAYPDTKVVKALNTTNAYLQVDAGLLHGDHDILICGNDEAAKAEVTDVLKDGFGWKSVIDLGDITGARTTEMLLPLWVRLYGIYGNPNFNFKIVR